MKEELLRLRFLQAENTRLRQLLGSKVQLPGQATIAEIIGVPPDPQRAAVILDKGESDGIARGYAVVDASGLLGQITDVSRTRAGRYWFQIEPCDSSPYQSHRCANDCWRNRFLRSLGRRRPDGFYGFTTGRLD